MSSKKKKRFALISPQDLEKKITSMGFDRVFFTVEKDIQVSFDRENVSDDPRDFGPGTLLGIQHLDTGMSFFGYCAGGDWQMPVFFLVYWDGKKLRGYVPYQGNLWNKKTMAAYGDHPEEDLQDIKARWPSMEKVEDFDEVDIGWDTEQILQEVLSTFEEKV